MNEQLLRALVAEIVREGLLLEGVGDALIRKVSSYIPEIKLALKDNNYPQNIPNFTMATLGYPTDGGLTKVAESATVDALMSKPRDRRPNKYSNAATVQTIESGDWTKRVQEIMQTSDDQWEKNGVRTITRLCLYAVYLAMVEAYRHVHVKTSRFMNLGEFIGALDGGTDTVDVPTTTTDIHVKFNEKAGRFTGIQLPAITAAAVDDDTDTSIARKYTQSGHMSRLFYKRAMQKTFSDEKVGFKAWLQKSGNPVSKNQPRVDELLSLIGNTPDKYLDEDSGWVNRRGVITTGNGTKDILNAVYTSDVMNEKDRATLFGAEHHTATGRKDSPFGKKVGVAMSGWVKHREYALSGQAEKSPERFDDKGNITSEIPAPTEKATIVPMLALIKELETGARYKSKARTGSQLGTIVSNIIVKKLREHESEGAKFARAKRAFQAWVQTADAKDKIKEWFEAPHSPNGELDPFFEKNFSSKSRKAMGQASQEDEFTDTGMGFSMLQGSGEESRMTLESMMGPADNNFIKQLVADTFNVMLGEINEEIHRTAGAPAPATVVQTDEVRNVIVARYDWRSGDTVKITSEIFDVEQLNKLRKSAKIEGPEFNESGRGILKVIDPTTGNNFFNIVMRSDTLKAPQIEAGPDYKKILQQFEKKNDIITVSADIQWPTVKDLISLMRSKYPDPPSDGESDQSGDSESPISTASVSDYMASRFQQTSNRNSRSKASRPTPLVAAYVREMLKLLHS